jgi:hypothetical protein
MRARGRAWACASCMRVMHADAHLSLSDLLSPLPHLAPPVLTCVFAESWVMETLKLFIYLVMFIYSFILICICIYQLMIFGLREPKIFFFINMSLLVSQNIGDLQMD